MKMQRDLVNYFNGKGKNTSKIEAEGEPLSPELQDTVKVWNHASMDSTGFCPDVDCAWTKVKSKLTEEKKVIALKYFYWAAASVTLMLGSLFLFQSGTVSKIFSNDIVISASEGGKDILLPDGSHVWIKEGSQISYSEDVPRAIALKGEAYFKVVHDPESPFVVNAPGISAKVIGTEFDLKNTKKGAMLAVVEGIVEVTTLDKVIKVQEQEQINTVYEQNLIEKSRIADLNFLSWKTGVMYFDNKKLVDILLQIEAHYRVDIEVADELLNDCSLSLTLKDLSLSESLQVVSTLLNGKVTQKENTYILTAGPCQTK